jgi:AraC-like DNA-binding protein
MVKKSTRSALKPESTIRAAALLGFRRLVRDLGGEPEAFLRDSGIDPAALASPDNRISYAAMIEMLENCAQQLDCPDFGLRLSDYQDLNILGPAALIAHYSDTVAETLRAIATYFYVHTTAAAVQLVRLDSTLTLLAFEVLIPGLHARRQINELSIGIGQSLLNLLIGPGFRSEHVQFAHSPPKDLRPLIRRFGSHLQFEQSLNGLTLPNSVLAKAVSTANPEFRKIAVDYVSDHLGGAEDNRVRRIVLLVHQLLPTGRCSLQNIANVLSMHPRTLQRELRSSGAEFRGIVDQARRELAADYLLETRATLSQVSAMLGYADQAAFNNAFQRWYGMPPGRWRKKWWAV